MPSGREVDMVINGAPVDLENVATASDRKMAVYTAIFSDYDEPPALQEIDDGIDYFLFTDGSVKTAPAPWQIRVINPIFADPQRDARRVKLLPHLFLPKHYETSVWVDSSLLLKQLSIDLIEQILGDADIAVTRHDARNCLYEEAKAVLAVKYESPARVGRQMSRYRMKGFPERFGLHATMFLARRHMRDKCLSFNLEWWEELSRFSKRDQLSFDYTRWRHAGVKVNTLEMNVHRNPIFGFKMKNGKEHKSGKRIVDEHLNVSLRGEDGVASGTFVYDHLYDLSPADFLAHLRNLKKIVSACSEAIPADLFSFGPEKGFLYSPPDPRKGPEREIFLHAISGRQRLLEMQFGYGARTALALSHTPISVTALDTSKTRHGAPCGGYLNAYFGNRLSYAKLDSTALTDFLGKASLGHYDAIHVDASGAPETTLHSLAIAVAYAQPGTVLIVSGLASERIANAVRLLRGQDVLVPHGDLSSSSQAAFIMQKAFPSDASDALANALVA
jgi:Protein of unknown function (DUF616)